MFRPLTSRAILLACSLLVLGFVWPVPTSCQAAARLEGDYGQLPLYFMENRGQINPEVRYYTQGSGFALGFTSQGPIFLLSPGAGQSKAAGENPAPGSVKRGALAARPGGLRKHRGGRAAGHGAHDSRGDEPEGRDCAGGTARPARSIISWDLTPKSGAPILPRTRRWSTGRPIRAST